MRQRTLRRAAERHAKKAAEKAARLAQQQPSVVTPEPRPASQVQIDANRANAQFSSGPKTDAGKAISSQNRFTHGLTYNSETFRVLPTENQDAYDALYSDLITTHQPANPAEAILVEHMAHHEWLYRRALRLQETTFDPATGQIADTKMFNLYFRYATTHERGLRQCQNDLARLRKERQQLEIGFEREKRTQQYHPIDIQLKEMEVCYRRERAFQLSRINFAAESAETGAERFKKAA
jgi:hypothetical protein